MEKAGKMMWKLIVNANWSLASSSALGSTWELLRVWNPPGSGAGLYSGGRNWAVGLYVQSGSTATLGLKRGWVDPINGSRAAYLGVGGYAIGRMPARRSRGVA